MAYWNWGVNFNAHANSHYSFMLEEEILIGGTLPPNHQAHTNYQIGDLVAVHKGHGLLAIAEVLGPQNPMPRLWARRNGNVVDVELQYGFINAHKPIYVKAKFKRVFPVMNGAGHVNDPIRQRVISDLWNLL